MVNHRSNVIEAVHNRKGHLSRHAHHVNHHLNHVHQAESQNKEDEDELKECVKCKGLCEYFNKYDKQFYACPRCRGLGIHLS